MLTALKHIHKEGFVHCNLDLDHVLVCLTPFGGDHFKLVDFDNARVAGSSAHPIFQNEKAKKEPYVAPEIADTPLTESHKPTLSTAADIWSLGVMTFILRTACLPMNRENKTGDGKPKEFDPAIIINGTQYEKIFDEDQKDFLIKCLQADPQKRATAEQLLEHSWITKNKLAREKEFAEAREVRINFAL